VAQIRQDILLAENLHFGLLSKFGTNCLQSKYNLEEFPLGCGFVRYISLSGNHLLIRGNAKKTRKDGRSEEQLYPENPAIRITKNMSRQISG
jgi:hypothetical protein